MITRELPPPLQDGASCFFHQTRSLSFEKGYGGLDVHRRKFGVHQPYLYRYYLEAYKNFCKGTIHPLPHRRGLDFRPLKPLKVKLRKPHMVLFGCV
jgi:hypothetical protein